MYIYIYVLCVIIYCPRIFSHQYASRAAEVALMN